MTKECMEIRLITKSGFMSHVKYETQLVLTKDFVKYTRIFDKDDFQTKMYLKEIREQLKDPNSDFAYASTEMENYWEDCEREISFKNKQKADVLKIFEFISSVDFKNDSCNVLDGTSLNIDILYSDNSKINYAVIYGDYIGEEYGDIHTLLQMIGNLIPEDKSKEDYFNDVDPDSFDDLEEEEEC